MKFLKRLLAMIAGMILLLVIIGLFLPKSVQVERSIEIDAAPAIVYGLISNFKQFNKWSPWVERDPEALYKYEGAEAGVGAKMSWTSDHPQVGNGSQEIVAATDGKHLKIKLDFGENGTGNAFFNLEPKAEGTHITWGFSTEFGYNLIGRYFGLFFEKLLGPDYDQGLASLKTLAESMPKVDFSDLDHEMIEIASQTVVTQEVKVAMDPAAIVQALGASYGQIMVFIGHNGLEKTGPPLTINRSTRDEYIVTAAIPIQKKPEQIDESSGVKIQVTYAGKALKVVHLGAYAQMAQTYAKAHAFMEVEGLKPTGDPLEIYISDPGSTPEDQLITHIFYPLGD